MSEIRKTEPHNYSEISKNLLMAKDFGFRYYETVKGKQAIKAKSVRTEKDHKRAMKRIEKLMDAKPNTKEGRELERLVTLVEAYEDKHYPII